LGKSADVSPPEGRERPRSSKVDELLGIVEMSRGSPNVSKGRRPIGPVPDDEVEKVHAPFLCNLIATLKGLIPEGYMEGKTCGSSEDLIEELFLQRY
jgi:hypothetical protein